jgi:ABC-type nitrate/sulfonate/bicarbonate transport system substrate-binding protein
MSFVHISVPDLISNTMFPVLAAKELGCFDDEGVQVDVQLHTGIRAIEALRDGSVEFCASGADQPLALFPGWRGVKLLAATAQGTPFLLVLRADLGVRRNDLRALRRHRIGAAPEPARVLMHLLDQAGIDTTAEEIEIVPIPGAAVAGVSTGVTAARALADGKLDGFWANALGAQVAIHWGIGEVMVDVRRGDGPPGAGSYTFSALATTDAQIERNPRTVEAVIRAVARAQAALRSEPTRARVVGERLFPALEAELIERVIQRDVIFYDASITHETFAHLSEFAQSVGLLHEPAPYDQVVATNLRSLWSA